MYLLLVLAEKVDTGCTANSQAGGEKPAAEMNPIELQFFSDCEALLLGLFR